MKHLFFFFPFIALIIVGCNSTDDRVLAEVYNNKLYYSEVASLLPEGLNKDDSIAFANQVINNWITEQIILHEAENELSVSEKIFDEEMTEYRKSLLRNKYFEKITSDTSAFHVSDEEVLKTIRATKVNLISTKEIVRINYVKLNKNSAVRNELKEILFDESRRMTEKVKIAELCGDSIEYFIEDDRWLYWEDIQFEISIDIEDKTNLKLQPEYFEKIDEDNCYLIVVLDYKTQQTGEESHDYFESVRTMLIQKKKKDFIDRKIDGLYQKAVKEEKIVR